MPWDQATWDYFSDQMNRMAAQSMQRDINIQMENGRRAGWPFPQFSNLWVVLKENLPPIIEIEQIWYNEAMRDFLIDTLFGIYVGELRRINVALIPEHSESVAFVHRNVKTSITGAIYWLVGEFAKNEENIPREEEFTPIGIPANGREVVDPGTVWKPGLIVTPTEPEDDTPGMMLPDTDNGDTTMRRDGMPGDEEPPPPVPDNGEPPGWPPPEWPPAPPPGGYPPEEEKPFPVGMVVAIGFGALALILLLKK